MVTAIIQARMGSTRLPGKAMKEINGEPMLFYVLKQVKACKKISKIIIATTNLLEDDLIEEYGKKLNFDVFRGNPNDVLDRYYQCAKYFELKTIVRITSDDPLIDPQIIENCLKKYENDNLDYVSNTISKNNNKWIPNLNGFPYGIAVEIFNFHSLCSAWKNSKNSLEREHVSPYFIKNPNMFRLGSIKNDKDLSHIRVTVDYFEDFKFVESILNNFGKKEIVSIEKITFYLDEHPELLQLNNKYKFNEFSKFE